MNEKIPFLIQKMEIPSYLSDCKGLLRLDALFMLLQEMSNKHASLLGAGWHDLQKNNAFWVITKMSLKINRMPRWTENIILRSWVRPSEIATSPRDYEIEDEAGNILISGSSVWAILDTEHGRPQRMSNYDGVFPKQDRMADCEKPKKIAPLHIPEQASFAKDVETSDIDMNLHVNNAHYIQWALNSVDTEYYKTHTFNQVFVNFIAQAKLGDKYSVHSEKTAEDAFSTAIFSPESGKEFCRIATKWIPLV